MRKLPEYFDEKPNNQTRCGNYCRTDAFFAVASTGFSSRYGARRFSGAGCHGMDHFVVGYGGGSDCRDGVDAHDFVPFVGDQFDECHYTALFPAHHLFVCGRLCIGVGDGAVELAPPYRAGDCSQGGNQPKTHYSGFCDRYGVFVHVDI